MSEIPEQFLDQAQAEKTEVLIDEMIDGDHGELLWAEIERMLASCTTGDKDAIKDMTLHDIIACVCEREAERMADAGELDEEAMECAVGYAEGMADARYDAEKDRRAEDRDR